jgi:hypothetical protein
VGKTLGAGFKRHGYDVRVGTRSADSADAAATASGLPAGTFAEVAAWADGLVLAVAGRVALEVIEQAGHPNLAGKIVIDVTNPIASEPPDDGVVRYFTQANDSLMERLQAAVPAARFVKAFNSVGNAAMVNPSFPGGRPTMFYCGNDEAAKAEVAGILDQFGWEPADMGTVRGARAIEPLCQLWCIPGFREGRWNHAFKLLVP